MKQKITVKKGKYFSLPVLTRSYTNCDTTSYTDSKIICQGFGIKKNDEVLKQFSLELKKYIVPLKHNSAKMFTSNAFVIEKSKPSIFMVTNDKI